MDPRDRFTDTVDDYARYRPDYPAELLDHLKQHALGPRIVELGAGTGILTRQLAERGLQVTAVEPNAAMRGAGERAGFGSWVAASAEDTGLGPDVADAVIGAQAFHWFDLERALPEIDRIARPGAPVIAAWNDRISSGFALDYDAALIRFSSTYEGVPRPDSTIDALRKRRPSGAPIDFAHHQDLDLAGVIGRAWSSSYVVHGVADRAGFDAALAEAFAAHETDGSVALRYRTVGWTWSARS